MTAKGAVPTCVLPREACSEPRLDPWKLDRFLVAAEAEDITPTIIANKSDLASEEEFQEEQQQEFVEADLVKAVFRS